MSPRCRVTGLAPDETPGLQELNPSGPFRMVRLVVQPILWVAAGEAEHSVLVFGLVTFFLDLSALSTIIRNTHLWFESVASNGAEEQPAQTFYS